MITLQLWYVIGVHTHSVLRDILTGAVETRISNLWNQKAKMELKPNKKQKKQAEEMKKGKNYRSFFTKTLYKKKLSKTLELQLQ